jgi:hypothetical protein
VYATVIEARRKQAKGKQQGRRCDVELLFWDECRAGRSEVSGGLKGQASTLASTRK